MGGYFSLFAFVYYGFNKVKHYVKIMGKEYLLEKVMYWVIISVDVSSGFFTTRAKTCSINCFTSYEK